MLMLASAVAFTQPAFAQGTPAKQPAQKLITDVVGKWQLVKTMNGKKDITGKNDSTGIQTIELTREAKFIMRDKQQKLDSGLFRINEAQKVIYFESKSGGDASPVEWNISLYGNQMTLTNRTSTHAKGYQYIYNRTSNKGK